MAVKSDVRTGHDIVYVTRGHASGCTGAMAYYTRTGDPPGTWEGRGTAVLGVLGTAEAEVAERLYQQGIGPGGERIIQHAAPKSDEDRAAAEAAAIGRYRDEYPFASASEINAERTRIRATSPGISRPYYDVTSSASKSVSVLHASLRVAAGQARQEGDEVKAAALDGEAQAIEDTLRDAMREGLELLEAMACYVRTGHHSKSTGQWGDGKGLVATSWLHTISRDGDPQLHVHLAVLNAVQRADGVGATPADITEVAMLAISGTAGADVVQVSPAPDLMDVSSLGIRESDGQSILRKPNTLRWSAVSHLNLEEQVIRQARRPIRPLVTEEQVRDEFDRNHQDLDVEQHQAIISLLTADRAMALLTAPAGAGKTRTITAAATVWHVLTGGRLIGEMIPLIPPDVLQSRFSAAGA